MKIRLEPRTYLWLQDNSLWSEFQTLFILKFQNCLWFSNVFGINKQSLGYDWQIFWLLVTFARYKMDQLYLIWIKYWNCLFTISRFPTSPCSSHTCSSSPSGSCPFCLNIGEWPWLWQQWTMLWTECQC